MSDLKILLKYTLLNSLGINKLKKKKSNMKLGFILGLLFLIVYAFITFYMLLFTTMFREVGSSGLIFTFGISIASILCLFSTITKANVYIFRTKDYDLLMSLPIKTSSIIASKILSLYIYNLLFSFTIISSITIAYFIVEPFSVIVLIYSFITIIFLPLLPMVLSSFVAFLLGFIPLRQKTRNILATILYVIFFMIFMFFYMQMMTKSSTTVDADLLQVYKSIGEIYFASSWIYNAMFNHEIFNFIIFLLISIVSMTLFIIVISSCFKWFNGKLQKNIKSNKKLSNNDLNYKTKSNVFVILKKELTLYISSPGYLVNTITGPILSTIAIILFVTRIDTILESLSMMSGGLPFVMDNNFITLLMSLMIVFCISLTSTTASSISLEGRSFWIIKSAPIKEKDLFLGKSLLNILIIIPITIIDMVVLGVVLKSDILVIVLATLIPVLYSISSSFIGLFFNLVKPKFDYDNPMKAVKSGTSVLFAMLFCMIITIIVFLLLFVITIFLNYIYALIIELFIAIIILIICTLKLFKSGVKRYRAIAC